MMSGVRESTVGRVMNPSTLSTVAVCSDRPCSVHHCEMKSAAPKSHVTCNNFLESLSFFRKVYLLEYVKRINQFS